MASVTTTTAAVDIDQFWTPELNRAVEFDTVVMALFDDRSGQLPHGNILNMPAQHNLTANTKTQGTDLTPEAITETSQTFTVATYQAVAQEIEDIAAVQSKYNLRAETTRAGAYSLARAQDVNATALFDDNTTQTVGTLGSELTVDNLIRARQYLKDSAAPMPYIMCVSPATYGGFLKVDMFTNSDYTGDVNGSAIAAAKVGKLFGADVYESQLLVGTAPNSSGHVWSKSHFFKIIQQAPQTHTWYSPLALSWIVTMSQIYDSFERQEADEAAAATTTARLWGVRLQSAK